MSERQKPEYADGEEIVVLTDENGVEHCVIPVLTARNGDAFYFYFYEAEDENPESPALQIMKLLSAPENGNEEFIPLDEAEWDEAAALYEEAMRNPDL